MSVEAGLVSSGSASGIELNPAVRFAVVLGETAGLEIAAKAPATYCLAVKKELWEGAGTSFEAALAGGLGPVAGPALMAGVSDKVQLSPDLSTFITWYPLVYLMDGRTGLGKSHWRAGLEWELEEAQLALGLTGNRMAAHGSRPLCAWRRSWLHIGIIAENWDSPEFSGNRGEQ